MKKLDATRPARNCPCMNSNLIQLSTFCVRVLLRFATLSRGSVFSSVRFSRWLRIMHEKRRKRKNVPDLVYLEGMSLALAVFSPASLRS